MRRPCSAPVRPQAHHLSQDAQLAGVVGVVAGDEVNLPQQGVAVLAAVGQRGEEVGFGVLDDGYQPLTVGEEGGNGLVPAGEVGGRISRRPVVVGPAGPVIVVRLDVVEDVLLGQAHVLQQMPEGVVAAGRRGVDVLRREIGHGVLKIHVRLPFDQQVDELFA